ncbi:hypothetical protein ACR03S_10015 [Limimaricola variabilis]
MGDQTTHLYRHFSSDGDLLYVGVSLSTVARLAQHRLYSGWFEDIARVEIEKFSSREAALAAEAIAVRTERPRCNVMLQREEKPKPLSAFEEFELARKRIYNRAVNLKPLYSVPEAAELLAMSDALVRKEITSGRLGAYVRNEHVRMVAGQERKTIRYAISGWHIIDYVESMEAEVRSASGR